MIQMKNNPIEGSAVLLHLSFKDPFGNFYIPTEVTYSFLALNSDKESWSVVDELYDKSLEPASTVALSIPAESVKQIEGTTTQRKIVVKWTAFVDSQYSDFIDVVNFDVQAMPYVPDAPETQSTTTYVSVVSCKLQTGSASAAPTKPVFNVKTNMPAIAVSDTAKILNEDGETVTTCSIEVDETNTQFVMQCDTTLEYLTSYTLLITGLKSVSGDYEMKEAYDYNFVTAENTERIQSNKEVTIDSNIETEILPDDGYDTMAKVTVKTDVLPALQEKEITVTENGTSIITPDSDYDGISKLTVSVEIDDSIALFAYQGTNTGLTFYSSREIVETGEYNILPKTTGATYAGFSNYSVTVNDSGIISFRYNGSLEKLTRSSGDDILRN